MTIRSRIKVVFFEFSDFKLHNDWRRRTAKIPARMINQAAGVLLMALTTSQAHAFPAGVVCPSGASDALCEIPLGNSLTLETPLHSIVDSGNPYRFELDGDVTVVTSAMRLPMLASQLVLEVDPETLRVLELYGSAQVPIDQVPALSKAEFEQIPTMVVGLVQAETIVELFDNALPLNTAEAPDGSRRTGTQPYLLMHADAGLSMKLDNLIGAETGLSFSVPAANPFTLVIDTLDPYIYISKSLSANNSEEESQPEYTVIAYEILDDVGNVERMVYEHYDQQGALAKKYVENVATGSVIEHAFDSAGHQTVTFFEPDGAGGYRQEGSDGSNGRIISANEILTAERDRKKTADDKDAADEESSDPFPIDAVGFSAHGWIPFEAKTTFGIPEESQNFAGQIVIGGEIPMGSPFVVLNGEVVTYVGEEGFIQGGNGELSVELEFLKGIVNFSLALGNATAAVQVSPDKQMTYISGELDPDALFLDDILPVFPKVGARAAGYIDNGLGDAQITIDGEFDLDADVLGNLIGVNLGSLMTIRGHLSIDTDGVLITGKTSTQIHPDLKSGSEISVLMQMSWASPEDIILELRGDMDVFGVGLEDVLVSISSQGMLVNGAFVTPLTRIGLAGSITDQGPSLTGSASVMLGLGDLSGSMKQVADDISAAQQEVDRLSILVEQARAIVRAERERDARRLQDAQDALSAAQGKLDSLNRQISAEYSMISRRKAEIASWKRWKNKAKWYQKAGRTARYAYEAGWRNADIAARYTKIGALQASALVAKGSMELAKLTLQGIEAATVVTPVDLDPRVASLIVTKETAIAALEVVKAPFKGMPIIDGDYSGDIEATLDISGLHGTVTANFDGYSALKGNVTFGLQPEACISIPTLGNACTRL